MPNRILKESICVSETVNRLSAEEERFFCRLIVQADDFGRMDARPAILRASCFPLLLGQVSDEMIEAWLAVLAAFGLIRRYAVGGRPLLEFVSWTKHQRVRARRQRYPAPPEHSPADDSNSPSIDSNSRADDSDSRSIDSNSRLARAESESESESEYKPLRGLPRAAPPAPAATIRPVEQSGDGEPPTPVPISIRPAPKEPSVVQKRQRAIFGALVERFGPASNESIRGQYNFAAKLLEQSGCDAEEVTRLADAQDERWPNVECTPLSIAHNVDRLRAPARGPPGRAAATPKRRWTQTYVPGESLPDDLPAPVVSPEAYEAGLERVTGISATRLRLLDDPGFHEANARGLEEEDRGLGITLEDVRRKDVAMAAQQEETR